MPIGRFLCATAICVSLLRSQPSGQDLIDGGHFKRLRTLVAARNPDDPETLILTAAVKHIWGDLDAAEKLADKAIAAEPNNARFHFRMAMIEGEKAQKASALHQFGLARRFKKEGETTLTLHPDHVRALHVMIDFAAAHWRLGLTLEPQGHKSEATAEGQQAVTLDANSPAKADLKRLK